MRQTVNFGRKTPPAIFSTILGLFGLGMSWRLATRMSVLPEGLADMIIGAVALLFVFAFAAYTVKFIRRPAALLEDARVLPGRGGLAASAIGLSALAAGLVPVLPEVAAALLPVAIGFHAIMAATIVYVMVTGPAEQRQVTPVWHLSFVGVIVLATCAVELGRVGLAEGILWATLLGAAVIYVASGVQLWQRVPPSPLRPLLAIHLAPVSFFGIVSLGLGWMGLAQVMAGLAMLVMMLLLAKARWLTEAKFSPIWSSFTFPLAAFATFFLNYADRVGSTVLLLIGGLAFVGATFFIPWVAVKVIRLWMTGKLAEKTNAAEA